MSEIIVPTWRYHKEHGARLCKTAGEVELLEAESWVDTPAKFKLQAKRQPSLDYAVMKKGMSRACRVFEDEKNAADFVATQKNRDDFTVVPRKRK